VIDLADAETFFPASRGLETLRLIKGKVNNSHLATLTLPSVKKGRGHVCEHANHLDKPVKTEGETKYVKCIAVGCDGSAKLLCDQFCLGVNIRS